jgi:mannosyl-3-phosphoglycerate phosphatase
MPESRRTVIVTDLDGTLLDRDTYSYQRALPALNAAQSQGIPVIFCSSKTRAEQMIYREMLGVHDPFIVEDGGALLVEKGYFKSNVAFHRTIGDLHVVELGTAYETIRQVVEMVRSDTGIGLKGYGDMTPAEVAEVTGLDREAATLAMKREYQETLVSVHTPNELELMTNAFAQHGMRLTKGGRFLAVSGRHDKGAAVDVLKALYLREFGGARIVGFGDSHNDLSMLAAVDVPVLVQKAPGVWEDMGLPNLVRVDRVGPEGWSQFVFQYLVET